MAGRADEKRAFEAMMAEISDDSDEDEMPSRTAKPAGGYSEGGSSIARTSFGVKSAISYADNAAAPKIEPSPKMDSRVGSKMSKEEESIENFGMPARNAPTMPEQTLADQNAAAKRWLMRSCHPSDPPLLCYVERERSGLGVLQPTYRCFLEGSDVQAPRFLMAAKKLAGKKTSYYLVSIVMDPDDRGSDSVLGKIRGNTVGSQYLLTDHGLAPDKTETPSTVRKELGLVRFEFDSGGPSRIEAWLPAVSSSGMATIWQPMQEDQSIEAKVEEKSLDRLLTLQNKKPKWDEAHGGHVLNFQGRVTESSVKNFQLCSADPDFLLGDEVLLQFGRVEKNKFTMDVRYPLSPYQAFAICVACMDGKLADRKGYEYLRKLTGSADAAPTADAKHAVQGSVEGSKSFGGALRQALPSGQYIRDKISRTFK